VTYSIWLPVDLVFCAACLLIQVAAAAAAAAAESGGYVSPAVLTPPIQLLQRIKVKTWTLAPIALC
jgi:hypothetical protein